MNLWQAHIISFLPIPRRHSRGLVCLSPRVRVFMEQSTPFREFVFTKRVCGACSRCFILTTHIATPKVWRHQGQRLEPVKAGESEKATNVLHWPLFQDFLRSAAQGCHICSLLLLHLRQEDRTRLENYNIETFAVQGYIGIKYFIDEENATYEIVSKYMVRDRQTLIHEEIPMMKVHLRPSKG